MEKDAWLAAVFEEHRARLRSAAYRMLGSYSEAEDAVQDAWLRVSAADVDKVEHFGGWLNTVVARVCLNKLRARNARPEDYVGAQVPDLFVGAVEDDGPERETLLADAVGAALLVVFDVLSPAERLAFVLHDVFGLPFEEIGPLVDRSPTAARQLASRARRRVRQDGAQSEVDGGSTAGRSVVRAFFAAARGGDFDALLHVLDPEVLMRVDGGAAPAGTAGASALVSGAQEVAQRALMFARPDALVYPAAVNGGPGVVVLVDGAPVSVMAFRVEDGRIAAIDAVVDRPRLAELDLDFLDAVGAF